MLPHDKANHFVYGTVIYTLVKVTTGNSVYACTATAVFGVLKEIYDQISKKGVADPMDLVATISPAILLYIADQ